MLLLGLSRDGRQQFSAVAQMLDGPDPGQVLAEYLRARSGDEIDRAVIEKAVDSILTASPTAIVQLTAELETLDVQALLSAVETPFNCIDFGSDSEYESIPTKEAQMRQGCLTQTVEGAGHLLMLEHTPAMSYYLHEALRLLR